MQKVIVFGSMNMDLTIESDRMPLAGETISGRGFFTNPGGKGANQAVAAARLGARTYMVGAVGQDTFGDQMIAALTEAGVQCECVGRLAGVPTGVACITRIGGDNRIILDAGANHVPRAADVAAALDRLAVRGDVFLAQLECDVDATLAAIAEAHRRGLYVMVNPAPARLLPDDIWPSVDLVCINETECETLTGIFPADEDEALRAMQVLAGKGAGTVVVTLGARGSVILSEGELIVSRARTVDAIDTTCAGDTYIGALAAGRASGMPLADTVGWATCASALATTKLGAQRSIPTVEEVEALLAAIE